MSNVTIGWNNATPTDSDLVGQGDDVIRSIKSNVQAALDAEHFFPSAGGAAGAHRRGSARIYVGPSSEVSSADTDGRMMWNSTTSQLNYLNSSTSVIVGGQFVPHFSVAPSSGSRYFAMDSGATTISYGTTTIYYSSYQSGAAYYLINFAAAPRIMLSLQSVEGTGREIYAPMVQSSSVGSFVVYWGGVKNDSVNTAVLNWLAIGERAYP
jgi:hypothetical protein